MKLVILVLSLCIAIPCYAFELNLQTKTEREPQKTKTGYPCVFGGLPKDAAKDEYPVSQKDGNWHCGTPFIKSL